MKIISFISCLLFLSCNNNAKEQPTDRQDTSIVIVKEATGSDEPPEADTITDTLMKLPFIVKSNAYIDSISNHQHGIAFMSDTTDAVISVRAGYNGAERFETYYDFVIDRKTGEIKIMDPVEGDYITLKEYLKNNQ